MQIKREFVQRSSDRSFTPGAVVRVSLARMKGVLYWRADAIKAKIERAWQSLANDCGNGLWPCEVAFFPPR